MKKFNTVYNNAKKEVKGDNEIYNKFVEQLDVSEYFTQSWRWNLQQSVLTGEKHIKQFLREVYAAQNNGECENVIYFC